MIGPGAPSDTLRFDGQVAIVTGAGSGIGRAHAHLLAARGAQVLVNDISLSDSGLGQGRAAAEKVADEIRADGGVAVPNMSDVTDPAGALSIVEQAIDEFGHVDIVANNAGIAAQAAVGETSPEEFGRLVGVHLFGTFNVVQAAWAPMSARGYGRILNTISSAVFGIPSTAAYSAAKGGILGLNRSLALEGAEKGIMVNAIMPYATTRMSFKRDASDDAPHVAPELVAAAAAYLMHANCPTSGELIAMGGGLISRVFVADTPGYYHPKLSPEHVSENWSTVVDEAGYWVPTGGNEHVARMRAAAAGRGVPRVKVAGLP